jgi:hypothetical protein
MGMEYLSMDIGTAFKKAYNWIFKKKEGPAVDYDSQRIYDSKDPIDPMPLEEQNSKETGISKGEVFDCNPIATYAKNEMRGSGCYNIARDLGRARKGDPEVTIGSIKAKIDVADTLHDCYVTMLNVQKEGKIKQETYDKMEKDIPLRSMIRSLSAYSDYYFRELGRLARSRRWHKKAEAGRMDNQTNSDLQGAYNSTPSVRSWEVTTGLAYDFY